MRRPVPKPRKYRKLYHSCNRNYETGSNKRISIINAGGFKRTYQIGVISVNPLLIHAKFELVESSDCQ
eukprot:scaffold9990_cov43-Cyclotella_meneghiniana.AAC.4